MVFQAVLPIRSANVSWTSGPGSKVHLKSGRDRVDAVLALVDWLGRVRFHRCCLRPPGDPRMGIVDQNARIVFGNPDQAGKKTQLLASPAKPRVVRSKAGRARNEIVGERLLQRVIVEIEIIDPAIDLESAPAALA